MTQFKHAAVLKMYAEDATKTQTPWDLWEVQGTKGTWYPLQGPIAFKPEREYRRKKPRIELTLSDGTVFKWPAPLTNEPEFGEVYYAIDHSCGVISRKWTGAEMDFSALEAGFVHDTYYAASHHYKAIKTMNLRGTKA